ncbi:MAG: DUF4432 family protein [Phycisphaeraceae bacterium]|nr:DUF4432 family protein [Phycisphaeraceae bacterium]
MSNDHARFISPSLQLGGIRTGTLDSPQPLGGQACKVAFVDTGAGLRFTVALDRGSDIVDATYNDCSLTHLGPNGLMPPSNAHQLDLQWLRGWACGLVTTCGPLNIGVAQKDDPLADGLHGRFSNTPAAVLAITNPCLSKNQTQMSITTRINDTRMFDPCIEVQRTIRCELGNNDITIEDVATNTGNTTCPHHWLYHCNMGYPLLAPGSRLIMGGSVTQTWGTLENTTDLNDVKKIPDILPEHVGDGSGGIIIKPNAQDGIAHVGLINELRGLAMRISFPQQTLPNLAIWQHFGPNAYVCGIEPFAGSLMLDDAQQLEPGESRSYHVQLSVLNTPQAIAQLAQYDAPLV